MFLSLVFLAWRLFCSPGSKTKRGNQSFLCIIHVGIPSLSATKNSRVPMTNSGEAIFGERIFGHEIFCRKFLFSNRHLNGGKMNVSAKKAENSLAKCKMPSDLCYAFEKKTSNISLLSDGANFFWVPLILPLQLPFFPPVNFLVLLTMPL